MRIRIIAATQDDIDDIFEIEKQSFDDSWSKEMIISDVVTNKLAKYFVARDENGCILGFAGMYTILHESHITNVAVLKGRRRLGVGTKLISKLIEQCIIADSFGLTLEVRVSNIAAIKAYEKLGFVTSGIRKNYYQNNNEDAYIMWLMLN